MLTRKSIITSTALICATVFATACQSSGGDSGSRYSTQKAVYHFNSANCKTTNGGLRNIKNHLNAVGDTEVEIIAVFHGGGVSTLFKKKTRIANKKGKRLSHGCSKKLTTKISGWIQTLQNRGVQFAICKNTLVGRKIPLSALHIPSKENVVPSGVAELSYLQQKGYRYIKP